MRTSAYLFKSAFALFLAIQLSVTSAFALTPEVKKFVTNETKANAVAARSDEMVKLEHYEIPLRLVGKDVADRIAPDVKNSLVFEKDGEQFVRWIINPEDTKWHLEMEEFLKKNGVEPVRHQYFEGYQTASRSYIVEAPDTKAQFSLKVSTNKTGGNWTDKKQDAGDAFDVRRSTDHVIHQGQIAPYQNFKVMDEPAAFGIKEIDQGMIVRVLGDLPDGKMNYLPGFSAMHEDVGREIARLNGSANPAEFWNQNYNKPLARALAELAAKTGVAYDSPHSQNFLVELDENMKPTGRMILRDMGDVYLTRDILEAQGNKALADSWPTENLIKGRVSAAVGIMHGNHLPSWLTEAQYTAWGVEYYKIYNAEFAKFAGVPLSTVNLTHSQSGRYFSKNIHLDGPEMKQYLENLRQIAVKMPVRVDPYSKEAKIPGGLNGENDMIGKATDTSFRDSCQKVYSALGKN